MIDLFACTRFAGYDRRDGDFSLERDLRDWLIS